MDKETRVREIYNAYPRHVAPGAARKAIEKVLDGGVPYETLLDRTRAYARAKEGCDKKYIPHPSTWFNQERYADDPDEWRKERGGRTSEQVNIRNEPKCSECSGLGHRQVYAIDPKARPLKDHPLGISCPVCRNCDRDYFESEEQARQEVGRWGWIYCDDQEKVLDWWHRLKKQDRAAVEVAEDEVPF